MWLVLEAFRLVATGFAASDFVGAGLLAAALLAAALSAVGLSAAGLSAMGLSSAILKFVFEIILAVERMFLRRRTCPSVRDWMALVVFM